MVRQDAYRLNRFFGNIANLEKTLAKLKAELARLENSLND
jgi:hypothetical protein